ncbi:hypothetical protein SARC_09654 [Sphaeroforma arctica JP610]|uniref:Mannitol dehydrogenase C-terminal domain-containing protein n=1 Tax=Sphaeroforma arctica JP610 TaxID=667725 RepID=A0A0L0FM99_9EUKA|nr:hypothetical protein SARC_09654 [Sphaeroforma arctica JP610]KNC77897.1 hypothetical protein SARC_09654 [Sphaeroforma arctica JP610]|eukprot:XP_014151799.1 hypothetical protein SARC_09654 [Sphaeroforma arctica JP610]
MTNLCKRIHIHLAAGKLGLGLALPELARKSDQAVITVQRASKQFKELASRAPITVPFRVNDAKICNFAVVSSVPQLHSALEAKESVDDSDSNGARMILLLSEDDSVVGAAAKLGTSFSTSLGPGLDKVTKSTLDAGALLDTEVSKNQRKKLYACENDHEAVEKLGKDLDKYIEVVPMLVDKICIDRIIGVEDGIKCTTESWEGYILPMDAASENPTVENEETNPWPTNSVTVFANNAATEEYLFKRKWYLVNGTHTTLAFLTVRNKEGDDHKGLPDGDHPLITYEKSTAQQRKVIDHWCVARAVMLFEEHTIDAICDGLYTMKEISEKRVPEGEVFNRTINYYHKVLQRMGAVDDMSQRVFDNDVKESFRIRLQPVGEFYREHAELSDLSKQFLQHVNVDEEELRKSIHHFTEVSEQFTMDSEEAI